MASEMTSAFRDFALKKFSEAKQRGATLATATAATASSITSNVPAAASVKSSFVFRSNASRQQDKEPLPLDKKLTVLKESNAALKKTAVDHPTETMDDAINKIDLINESMAFTIENIQECSHVMKMMQRQLRDLGAMRNADDLVFYRHRTPTSSVSIDGGDMYSADRATSSS